MGTVSDSEESKRYEANQLFKALPMGAPDPNQYIPLSPILGVCPECHSPLKLRLMWNGDEDMGVSVAFKCTSPAAEFHSMAASIWKPVHGNLTQRIQGMWFMKKLGLPFDRPLNDEEQATVAKQLEKWKDQASEPERDWDEEDEAYEAIAAKTIQTCLNLIPLTLPVEDLISLAITRDLIHRSPIGPAYAAMTISQQNDIQGIWQAIIRQAIEMKDSE